MHPPLQDVSVKSGCALIGTKTYPVGPEADARDKRRFFPDIIWGSRICQSKLINSEIIGAIPGKRLAFAFYLYILVMYFQNPLPHSAGLPQIVGSTVNFCSACRQSQSVSDSAKRDHRSFPKSWCCPEKIVQRRLSSAGSTPSIK